MEVKDYLIIIISMLGAILSLYFSLKAKKHSDTVLLNDYINEATREFNTKGSAKNYIDSLVLNGEKKDIIWRQSYLRHKGRYPDRHFSDIPAKASGFGYSVGEYKPIMEALGNGQYEDRTAKKLSEETKKDVQFVSKALGWFWDNGLVQKRSADDGTYWSLTDEGWKLYEAIRLTEKSKIGEN